MLLHKDWKYITDMSHLNEGCILVFDKWYSGFRILNSTTNAGTLPYINPQAARKAYEERHQEHDALAAREGCGPISGRKQGCDRSLSHSRYGAASESPRATAVRGAGVHQSP
jgi:hypothetical protein